jgi:hypothetical protein
MLHRATSYTSNAGLLAGGPTAKRATAPPMSAEPSPAAPRSASRRARRAVPTARTYPRALTAMRCEARTIVVTSFRHTGVTEAAA